MNKGWFVFLAALAAAALSGGCRGASSGAGCSNDQDCKGARVCVDHQCSDPPLPTPARVAPTAAATPTATPAAAHTRSRSVVRRYRCASDTPTEARGGCICGNEIINLCPCSGGLCSPEFTIQGDTCVFTCPN